MSAFATLLLNTFQLINNKKYTSYLSGHNITAHWSLCLKSFKWLNFISNLLPLHHFMYEYKCSHILRLCKFHTESVQHYHLSNYKKIVRIQFSIENKDTECKLL